MKKFLVLFLFVLISSCSNNYTNFHENISNFSQNKQISQEKINDFSLKDLRKFENIEIASTPDKNLIKKLREKIKNAKSRIYIEMYIFTEKDLRKELINAKKRGIDIQVILEKNVYMASNLNKQTFDDFSKSGIKVTWASSENFALTHTKLMIIDDEIIISTANYSYSSFSKNREFFLFIKDNILLKHLLSIFEADFLQKKEIIYDSNLVLSPYYTRNKFEILLKSAKKSIKMYIQNFDDEEILNILKQKKEDGIDIELILPDLKSLARNKEEIEKLDKYKIKYKLLKSPYIHAKSILIDDEYLYLGSINMSYYSIEKNREIGVILKEENIIKNFKEIFINDFQK
ncbi:MAG: phospholipase D-like domain-containing protein [Candidatus Gracilibacteria bacterium]|nr:phospholipase D-like domain-containing protein [Candidatus Gracilibacteria bacterium]